MTANQLQKLLDRAGISQRGAARELGINERTMRLYVAGDAVIPRTVELACKYLWEKVDGK
jgi:DNA-binding XRE family transcriptional regulator